VDSLQLRYQTSFLTIVLNAMSLACSVQLARKVKLGHVNLFKPLDQTVYHENDCLACHLSDMYQASMCEMASCTRAAACTVAHATVADALTFGTVHQDVSLWRRLAKMSSDQGFMRQAIYCYNRVIAADRGDLDALWDRAVLYSNVDQPRKVFALADQVY
jgi:hypothetical protein